MYFDSHSSNLVGFIDIETCPPGLERMRGGGGVARKKTDYELYFNNALDEIKKYLTGHFNSAYKKQRLLALYFAIKNKNHWQAEVLALQYRKDMRFCRASSFSKNPSKSIKIVNDLLGVIQEFNLATVAIARPAPFNPKLSLFNTLFKIHRRLGMGKVFRLPSRIFLLTALNKSLSSNDIKSFIQVLKELFSTAFVGRVAAAEINYTALSVYTEKYHLFHNQCHEKESIGGLISATIQAMQLFYSPQYPATVRLLTSVEDVFHHCVNFYRHHGHGDSQSQEYFETILYASFLECNHESLNQNTTVENLKVPQWIQHLCYQ
jgi:hypothetical protein